ncbi:MAG: BTAD domain-containing putative transcriptional regulator [Betaproteobacteria bacterium]
MKSKSASARLPAKLVSPDTGRAVPRTRLFNLIDAQPTAGIWIHGPPGSGKTTLAASYLHTKNFRPIWYQMDVDDAEPSTFFHFLAIAFAAAIPTRHKLPVVDIESRGDWVGFARRFFRALVPGLNERDVVVFENIHETNGALDDVLAAMAVEAGTQQRVIFTSHHRPPAPFVDLLVKRQIVELDADTLRFNLAETGALISAIAHPSAAPEDIERLNTLTDGWAAGIVLLGTQPLSELGVSAERPESRARLAEYFSHVVIGKMTPETRNVLAACAFIPHFNADLASAASGDPRAGEILETLQRNGHFVERRMTDTGTVFRCHNLLAEALRDRIGAKGSKAHQLGLAHAGNLLANYGRIEEAIPLLLEAGDHNRAADHILQVVETVLAEGRLEQLVNWISTLAKSTREELPWLNYWLGQSLAPTDETAARDVLANAYLLFQKNSDQLGCVLSSAALVTGIESGWQSFEGFDQWITALYEHWSSDIVFPTSESELRAISGLLVANSSREMPAGLNTDFSARVVALIPQVRDANAQLLAAEVTVNSFLYAGEHERALFFENLVKHEVSIDRASPSRRANWHWTLSIMHVVAAHSLLRPELMESGRKHGISASHIAEIHTLIFMKISIAHAEADRFIQTRNATDLKRTLDKVEALIRPNRIRQMVWHLNRRAQLALLCSEPQAAWIAISRVFELTREAHFPDAYVAPYFGTAGNVLAQLGRYDEAINYVAQSSRMSRIGAQKSNNMSLLFFAALKAIDGNDDCDRTPVAAFLRAMREQQMLEFGRVMGRLLTRLCAIALAKGIESEFIRSFILHRKFLPPTNAPASWPWPLRIEALGDFKVVVADRLLGFEGKGQKKPLELLKFIVCSQASAHDNMGPSVKRVIDELWPDMDAKDPQGSFEIALHRLRKLIGVENIIVLSDGRVSLNSELAWCDVTAFETSARSERFDEVLRATALYTGPLLGSSTHVWAAAPRERLAAKFAALVDRCAQQMESDGDYSAAITLYERALQQDNLIEAFYRGQMRCYKARGEVNEAKRVYRRCKELLSIVLGAKPTAETEALNARIAC